MLDISRELGRLRGIIARVASFARRGDTDQELREELETHLAMATEHYRRRGLSPNDARKAALIDAGGVTAAAEACREQRGFPFIERLAQDVRYGVRMLRRAPTFTFVAVGAIGLAVGINAGFFTLVDALMLQPIPVVNPTRLVKLLAVDARGNTTIRFSYPAYLAVREHASMIEDLVAFTATPVAFRATPAERATAVSAGCVSGNYFSALGARATLGRLLVPDDDADGAPAIVISEGFWTRAFGRAADVVGRDIIVNGTHATIVGIAAHDFIGINPLVPDMWMPIVLAARVGATPGELRAPGNRFLVLHGRLRDHVDRRRAEAELSGLVAEPRGAPGTSAELTRLTGVVLQPNEAAIPIQGETALLAAPGFIVVLLVLVIACANLANLLLARALIRQREIAIRLALGASRARIVRQLLTESLLIALVGSGAGLLLAKWTVDVMTRSFLAAVPTTLGTVALHIAPSWRVLAYTLGLTVISTLIFGLAPALQATTQDLAAAIKGEDALFGTRIRRSRFRDILVSAQVAACLVLLAAAGTLVKSLRDFADVATGLDTRSLAVSHLGLTAPGHVPQALAANRVRFAERVGRLREVTGTALVLAPPFTGWPVLHVADNAPGGELHGAFYNVVTPTYFDVIGQRIVAGRTFAEGDSAEGARVAVVSASAARALWPRGSALGRNMRIAESEDGGGRVVRIVGVAADARSGMIWDPASVPYIYLPATGKDLAALDMSLLVRGRGAATTVDRAVSDVARQLDPDAPLTLNHLSEMFTLQLLPYRYAAAIASGVGVLGVALAVLGLYGVVAFAVTQRRRELAIHVAMGAAPGDVLGLVTRGEMRLVVRGLLAGLVLALGEAKLLGSIILPLSPIGVIGIGLLAAGLVLVALVATVVPGLSALRIAPMQVLRQE